MATLKKHPMVHILYVISMIAAHLGGDRARHMPLPGAGSPFSPSPSLVVKIDHPIKTNPPLAACAAVASLKAPLAKSFSKLAALETQQTFYFKDLVRL